MLNNDTLNIPSLCPSEPWTPEYDPQYLRIALETIVFLPSIFQQSSKFIKHYTFMCCLRTCICRACRVGQTLGQWEQKTPPMLTCFDSMWFMRPFLWLAWYWHSRHSHPWSVRVISSRIRFSISEGNSGNNNHVALLSLLSSAIYGIWNYG